ncbi:DUF4394 domain-containing protein [Tundrisphaera sp. TA3]|uniref:DUF4394 domain-containing protein n=1 Tax=Tundrisphaera sp. TA3 TaxID=3435775 RepID=UPI003EB6C17E
MTVSLWGSWQASRSASAERRDRQNRKLRSIRLLEQCEDRTLMATALGVTAGNTLIRFDTAAPSAIIATTPITGLAQGDTLNGLDFRPSTGQLYGLGNGRLYTIDVSTGAATQVGADGAFTLNGTAFGFDFNPVPDRARVTSDSGQNLRLNPNDGTLTATDGALAYSAGTPRIVASAYTNSFAGSTSTTLYNLDSTTNSLVIQDPPNAGTLTNVGALGVDFQDVAGFDILSVGANTAFAALTTDGVSSSLYTIDLATGAATPIGAIGSAPTLVTDIAIVPEVPPSAILYGIDATTGNLVRFSSNNISTAIISIPITGLASGESILDLDFRPSTGQLYGLGNGRLYTINPLTGAATQVGADGAFTLNGTTFGFDFNPVPDRARVTSDADQNLRLNPNDGTLTATDGALAYASGNPNVVSSAYTNSFAGSTSTTLYNLDSTTNSLVVQDPPNAGTLTNVGALGVDFQDVAGFDILSFGGIGNLAFAALTTDGVSSSLYTIDLGSGQATRVGASPIGGATPLLLRGLAVAPFGSFRFSTATYSTGEAGPFATITVNRVEGSEGIATIRLTTSDGTATSPADYTAFDQVLVFGPGETSKTIQIPIIDDGLDEPDATINLALTNPTGGAALGTVATAVLTIIDDDAAPVAANDAYSTPQGTPLTVPAASGVLANDTDADLDPLTAVIVANPANGTLTLNADGSFTYTPNAGFSGQDSFTYRANDGSQASNIATVTLTVTFVNTPPVALPDTYTTPQGTVLTIDAPAGVLANDTDVDNSPLSAVLVAGPANGTLILNPEGSFTYTPNPGFFGVDSFTYRASDAVNQSDLTGVTILVSQVVATNPVAVADTYTVSAGAALTVPAPGVLGNDNSPTGAALTAVLVGGPANGALVFNADGSFTYTPNPGFSGLDSFTYRAGGGGGQSDIASVSIAVTAVNGAPVSLPDFYNGTQGTPLVVAVPGVLGNDFDPEGSSLTAVLVTTTANGVLTLAADGSFIYTPNAGFVGADSFTYQANDGTQNGPITTVTLTIAAANAPPVIPGSQTFAAIAGQSAIVGAPGILANATDPEGNPLSAILVTPPANGTLILNADGSFAYTPNAGFSGVDQFTFRASDGTSQSNLGSVILNVSPAPVFVGPRVAGVVRYGTAFQKTTLVISFDGPVDPATASLLSNYRVSRGNGASVRIRSIRFIARTNQVVLTLAQRLPLRGAYRVAVNGGPGGIRSIQGVGLDGAGNNRPGTDFAGRFNRASYAGPARKIPR